MPGYPDVNGIRYDFSSVEFDFSPIGSPIVGVQAIDYDYSLTPGAVRGTAPQKIGRTRGLYDSDCTVTVFKAEEDLLFSAVEALGTQLGGLGFMETPFDIVIIYSDYLQPVITDVIRGCRVKKPTQNHKSGSDPLQTKVEMDVMYVLPNGRLPYTGFFE